METGQVSVCSVRGGAWRVGSSVRSLNQPCLDGGLPAPYPGFSADPTGQPPNAFPPQQVCACQLSCRVLETEAWGEVAVTSDISSVVEQAGVRGP